MKKFVSILISLALAFTFTSIGLFAEPNNTTTIEYDVPPSYILVIPKTVDAGSSFAISAASINNRPEEKVVVTISGGISDSCVTLNRQTAGGYSEDPNQDGTNVLAALTTINGGDIDNSTHIAEFYDSTDNLIEDPVLIEAPNTLNKLAGTYKGTLTFSIDYEEVIFG